MMEINNSNYPCNPKFRASASQALQKALKKGRLLKTGSLYKINPEFNPATAVCSYHTPLIHSRRIRKRHENHKWVVCILSSTNCIPATIPSQTCHQVQCKLHNSGDIHNNNLNNNYLLQ